MGGGWLMMMICEGYLVLRSGGRVGESGEVVGTIVDYDDLRAQPTVFAERKVNVTVVARW